MSHIAVINYDVGNIKSICNAFEKVGSKVNVTRTKADILAADGIVLPGVGAFAHGMDKLNEYGLVDIINEFARTGKPVLGICLGMQMLFNKSSEFGETEGLGLISGEVIKMPTMDSITQKLPHVGWSELYTPDISSWNKTIFDRMSTRNDMYFVHSYVVVPKDRSTVLATSIYSNYEFCSAVKKENIYGCQFHPEKSAKDGLQIINNFVEICSGRYQ